jgi:hypothetical protein
MKNNDERSVLQPVFVIWEDAYSIDHWTDREEIEKNQSTIVHSAGFLIESNNDRIILALNHDTSNDCLSCIMVIPKDMIRALVTLDK